jgi:hypothetical protein
MRLNSGNGLEHKRKEEHQVSLVRRSIALVTLMWMCGPALRTATGAEYKAGPSNYSFRIPRLKPGDTLNLSAGTYPGMTVKGLHGSPSAWIIITGPASGAAAVIVGSACCNVVEILNSSFVSIENLTIDSKGIEATFGVSVKDGMSNLSHDIRIQNNRFIGQGASQQTVAISTKAPAWGWVIRNNRISGAGTGIYLGNSDGTAPFVAGLIENNRIENTIGYNMEIKWQRPRPAVPGMPTEPQSTIIRNNIFIKDDRPSPDGDRPNVLVGGFPESGPGSADMYEIYENVFATNPRETLLQASGRVSIHDNIFVGGDDALALQSQDLPLKVAHIYNNTIYTEKQGIVFGSPATVEDAVIGNLIFASVPIAGPVKNAAGNISDTPANAGRYVKVPSFDPNVMDFYPLAGKCQGAPLVISRFASEMDSGLDFNRMVKESANHEVLFRGAYAGAGANPGSQGQMSQVGAVNAAAALLPMQISPSAAKHGESGSFLILLHAPKGMEVVGMQWELSALDDVTIAPNDVVIGSVAEAAEKSLVCSAVPKGPGKAGRQICLLSGGGKKIADGPIAIVRYRVGRQAHAGNSAVRIDQAVAVTPDRKTVDLGHVEGFVTIQ